MRLKNVKNASEKIKESKYVIVNPQDNKGNWKEIFNNDNPIHIEIGTGKGKFIIEMALKYTDVNFVGIEKYNSVLLRAAEKLEDINIPNLKLIAVNADHIEDIFNKEVNRIYLNFSDPWPKDRHYKRRLTSPDFLTKYDRVFKNTMEIHQKTDNINLFDFSIKSLQEHGYELSNVTYDLANSNIADNITTEYEEKFSKNGVKINRLEAYKDNCIAKNKII